MPPARSSDLFAVSPDEAGTLGDSALAELRRLIASGELKPGDRIVEREIADRYGMSRGPVREAIRALEHEGLVESRPYAGVRVVQVGRDEIEELIQLRRQVEYFSIARAALHATAADIETLSELADRMLPAYRDHDILRCIELDFRFHLTVCDISGHPILGQMLKTLMPRLMVLWYPDFEEGADAAEQMRNDHCALVEPIRAHDVDASLAAIDRHIDDFYAAITLRYDREAVDGNGSPNPFRPVRPKAIRRPLG